MSFIGYLLIYLVGGITFLPLLALAAVIYIKGGIQPLLPRPHVQPQVHYKDPDAVIVKKGWIRLINQYQPKMPEVVTQNTNGGIISGIQSYVSKETLAHKKGLVYAVLKHGTLFCYESEKQQEVIMILPMQDFIVSLYPPIDKDAPDGTIYSRATVIRLVPNALPPLREEDKINKSICTLDEEDITINPARTLYLTCARNTDKEDWYFGLLEAQYVLLDTKTEKVQFVMMDNTHFDQSAMEELIRQVQSSPSQRETAWANAVLGRLFLGMYKTDRLKLFVENKIRKKIDKTKRPTFLDEIKVRKVDVGSSVPYITDPKLLSLSPDGEVVVEAKVEYNGGLTIEIETAFNWSYSSLMKPIRMHLVLSVNLKKLSGRMMFKLKPPPTNRYWLGFFEMPEMEWKITPIVADKQIKLSIVTNAIESRIREVMAETFVLPNMDDTSFCHSDGKGGIFGERTKAKVEIGGKSKGYTDQENESDNVRHTPTVPDIIEKPPASDTLKLDARRAESASEFIVAGNTKNSLAPTQKLEVSHSTPDMQFVPPSIAASTEKDNESIDQRSIAESTGSSSNTKWSSTSNYLRKRVSKTDEDDNSDSESIKSVKSSNTGSGFLNKISNFLPTENTTASDTASIKSSSSTGSATTAKRNSFINRAENYLIKKAYPAAELLNEEKKGLYAERLSNMRKRVAEKAASLSSVSSSTSLPPPPLPPLPTVNKSPSSTSSTPSISEELDVFKELPITNTPHRERSASVVHINSFPQLSQLSPPLPATPSRRNSTPVPLITDLIDITADEQNTVVAPVLTKEPEHHPELLITDEKPPLPTTPRPKIDQYSKPTLPPRDAHVSPTLPPRHV
ncbi:hypothetical protein MFLAVUS_010927 [Mucor flavus]|uniref:SMP-LTD domain-containing protein n=1 Tax=Mucor flavus TaxID=439312 RepID=A0ABP9ZE37_9FUNG